MFNSQLRHVRQQNKRAYPRVVLPKDIRADFDDRLSFFKRDLIHNSPDALVTSFFELHVCNDISAYLKQVRTQLKPDGLFMACFPGGESLRELREAFYQTEIEMLGGVSPRIHPMITIQDMGMLLQQAGFSMPVLDVDRLTLRFQHVRDLIGLIRFYGETNCLTHQNVSFLGKTFWDRVSERCASVTLEIIYATAWVPAHNHPTPLKPGSAKHSLAAVLST